MAAPKSNRFFVSSLMVAALIIIIKGITGLAAWISAHSDEAAIAFTWVLFGGALAGILYELSKLPRFIRYQSSPCYLLDRMERQLNERSLYIDQLRRKSLAKITQVRTLQRNTPDQHSTKVADSRRFISKLEEDLQLLQKTERNIRQLQRNINQQRAEYRLEEAMEGHFFHYWLQGELDEINDQLDRVRSQQKKTSGRHIR